MFSRTRFRSAPANVSKTYIDIPKKSNKKEKAKEIKQWKSQVQQGFTGGGASSLSSLTGTEQGLQAAECAKAFSWRAFWRRLQEIKSPQPHFKKVVVSKTSLLREVARQCRRVLLTFHPFHPSTFQQFCLSKGGGVEVPEGNPSPELLNSLSSLSNSTLSLKGRGRVKNSRFTFSWLLSPYSPNFFKPLSYPIGHPLPEGEGNREPLTPHSSPFTYKKAAFTLAEVLITLGIIGVVAAMTLTALVGKYPEKVWITRY